MVGVVRNFATLAGLAKRAVVRLSKSALRAGARGRPVPLPLLLRLRSFGGRPNMLNFPSGSIVRTGASLANPFLAERLAERRFGDWTISAQALNLLEQELRNRPPRRVLEFGSGLSTACIARYMTEQAPGDEPRVVSVEADGDFCAESRAILAELALERAAEVHHVPLARAEIAGRSVNAYDLPPTCRIAYGSGVPTWSSSTAQAWPAGASPAGPSSTLCSPSYPAAFASTSTTLSPTPPSSTRGSGRSFRESVSTASPSSAMASSSGSTKAPKPAVSHPLTEPLPAQKRTFPFA